MIQGRDPWDDSVTTDEKWISIVFEVSGSGSDLHARAQAELWAKSEFGDGFFRLGNRFFFDDPGKLVLFKLRCS